MPYYRTAFDMPFHITQMSIPYHSGQVVQQESSRKKNGHSLSKVPVLVTQCNGES